MRVIYFAYAHLIMTYGINFWGSSSSSLKLFILQKRMIRIMNNLRLRDSCRIKFKELRILRFFSQYIYSVLIYLAGSTQLFTMNREVHNYKTRNKSDFHLPNVNLTKYQKGVYYIGVKLYNHLLTNIKNLVYNQNFLVCSEEILAF
jgi:hypothetical protein